MTWKALGPTALVSSSVFPLNDLREHDPDSVECWCSPTWDGDILVHHSMDGREGFEDGRRMS